MARVSRPVTLCALCVLQLASAHAQNLPEVDVDALMEQVNALADQLRTEARRLIDEEGAEKAVERLRAEAEADDSVAFQRVNLAGVVAVLAGDEDAATSIIREMPAATEEELPSALARHLLATREAGDRVGTLSLKSLVWQGGVAETLEAKLLRWAPILAGIERLAPDSEDLAYSLNKVGAVCLQHEDFDRAVACLERNAAIRRHLAPDSLQAADSLGNLGFAHLKRGDYDLARDYLSQCLEAHRRLAPDTLQVAGLLGNIGFTYSRQGNTDLAIEYYQQSLDVREGLEPDTLAVAQLLHSLGSLNWQREDGSAALECHQRSLAIRERLAPGSLEVAYSLNGLGLAHAARGDLDDALDCYKRSLAMQERLAPDTLNVADTLNNLGEAYSKLGALSTALEHHERALGIQDRLAPDSLALANSLGYIGSIHVDRGDLDLAIDCYRRSLVIHERLGPDTSALATALLNLGVVHSQRGDYEGAIEYFRRSLAIQERVVPDSTDVAASLLNLGYASLELRDPDAALANFRRSLQIWEDVSPNSLSVATALHNIGAVHEYRGEFDLALEDYGRSLSIKERLQPHSLPVAASLNNIGLVHRKAGHCREALGYLNQALGIYEALAPGSLNVVKSLVSLSSAHSCLGDLAAALTYSRRAVESLEAARGSLDPAGRGPGFLSGQYASFYRDLVACHIEIDDLAGAADAAERMRARSYLALVGERSLAAAPADPELGQAQEQLDARRDRLYGELRELVGEAAQGERAAELRTELLRVKLDYEVLEHRIRETDPRYASLKYPQPLTTEELETALDPGTVVLSYVAGSEQTFLFCLGPGIDTTAHIIEVGQEDLTREVEMLLGLVRQRQDATDTARHLWELLLGPVADVIADADRVLILPDGPLWALPFQALMPDEDTYLCDVAPIHYAPSATVFVENRRFREGVAPGEALLAVGDPDYSVRLASSDGERGMYIPLRSGAFEAERSTPGGITFDRLAYSGLEASLTAAAFGEAALLRQGIMAKEAAIREEAPGMRILHVASHALLDPVSPMDSALVLSLPRKPEEDHEQDGFLKAWEVFGLDLSGCDLVTLSACETAKGEVLSGEGVIGLTRAFMYAGAASVLCTQWKVADDSTAALVVRFYSHYRDGDPKDVALKKAMRETRTGETADGRPLELPAELGDWDPKWSHPYFWAPFILMGEYLQT